MNTRAITVVVAAGLSALAHSQIIITPGPGNFQGDENLLFNQPGLIATGPLVQGATNQTHFIVDLYDAFENLTTPPGGQARVEAVDGGLTDLKLKIHDPAMGFGTLIWNLNASAAGNVTLTVYHNNGPAHIESFSIDQGGENFFRIEADAGDSMIIAQLHTDVDLQDVKQIRLGLRPVPEPASLLALALGLVGLGAARRRK